MVVATEHAVEVTPFQVYRMPVGEMLHNPSCRVQLKVVAVVRNSDSPALMVQAVGTRTQPPNKPRRATVSQLNGYHLAAGCAGVSG